MNCTQPTQRTFKPVNKTLYHHSTVVTWRSYSETYITYTLLLQYVWPYMYTSLKKLRKTFYTDTLKLKASDFLHRREYVIAPSGLSYTCSIINNTCLLYTSTGQMCSLKPGAHYKMCIRDRIC